MRKEGIAVTVRREVLRAAERLVKRGRARSVSAWVNADMEQQARLEDLAALVADMAKERGPVSEEAETWARGVLGL